ncbi:MAG: hypothetical protein HOO86_09775 [Bacteroidales bacterium]|nr:hypothetical protein [Bacteroidales bacterium]
MKKNILKLILFSCLIIVGQQLLAQGPPDPPGDPSIGGPPVGGSAPIGGGSEILLLMGLAYGSKKTYQFWKHKQKIED